MGSPLHFGKYLLIDKIGTGGMAELYLAKQSGVQGFEKVIAIKRILPHLTQDTEFVTMFINEAKLAALLSHQNIVQIFDLGHVDGVYYIAMEYLMGKDLRSVLNKRRDGGMLIPIDLAVMIAARICSALDYAHRKSDLSGNVLNIVHRDVSPQNILISYEGEVKIVDFGIAKAASSGSETRAGVLKGKLAYMSPEQARGDPIDRRSDVFATGVVLYEMLTGERPFKAESDFELLEKVRQASPQPPSSLNPGVYPELEKIVMKAMALDPAERYSTSSGMEVALESLIVSQGYALSSLNLSQYMAALFKQEMELETARFQIATTIDAGETQVEPTIRRPAQPPLPAGPPPRSERTPSSLRVVTGQRRKVAVQRRHPVLNSLLLGLMALLIALPALAYVRPHLLLDILERHAWLRHLENPVRSHLETLGLIETGPKTLADEFPAQMADLLESADSEFDAPTAQSSGTDRPAGAANPETHRPQPVAATPRQIGETRPDANRPPPPKRLGDEERRELRSLLIEANRQNTEGDLDGLEATLRKIIDIHPRASRAYDMLGKVYLRRKDEAGAFRIFLQAVSLFPRDPMLHHDLGNLYYNRGYYDLARQEFTEALDIAPQFPKAEQARQMLMSLKETESDPSPSATSPQEAKTDPPVEAQTGEGDSGTAHVAQPVDPQEE